MRSLTYGWGVYMLLTYTPRAYIQGARTLTRLTPVDPQLTTDSVKETLDELGARTGGLGPMVLTMATSSALLRGYAGLNRAMKRSHLDRRITERISLAVQEWLGCAYCVAAHSDAARALGVTETDIQLARHGTATDPKIAAIVAFGLQVVAAPSEIGDADVEALRGYGYRDEQIADVVGLVALNVLTGSFNLVAGIEPAPQLRSVA
jgi:uncharacterized peroxidase-related enzyme